MGIDLGGVCGRVRVIVSDLSEGFVRIPSIDIEMVNPSYFKLPAEKEDRSPP